MLGKLTPSTPLVDPMFKGIEIGALRNFDEVHSMHTVDSLGRKN